MKYAGIKGSVAVGSQDFMRRLMQPLNPECCISLSASDFHTHGRLVAAVKSPAEVGGLGERPMMVVSGRGRLLSLDVLGLVIRSIQPKQSKLSRSYS